MLEIIGIAESTPGPIAINMATYIGYKRAKILGSFLATRGSASVINYYFYDIALFLRLF